MDLRLVLIHTVNEPVRRTRTDISTAEARLKVCRSDGDAQCASAPDVVDRIVDDRLDAGRLDDHVEPVRVVRLELGPLRLGVFPVELDVDAVGRMVTPVSFVSRG